MSWLVSGDWVLLHNSPNMDIDLYVDPPTGSSVASGVTGTQSFEIVKFTAPVTGTYKLRLERYSNAGQGNVAMGSVIRGR